MLDMAVFHSLSSHVAQVDYKTKNELVAAVEDAWAMLPPETLMMEWACKAVTMRQFVDFKGQEFKSAHPKLRKALLDGRITGLWERVRFIAGGGYDFVAKCDK